MNTKFRAYTLTEVLITLLLITIITSACYNLFNLLNKQLLQYKNSNQFDVKFNIFDATINRDLYNATSYELNSSQVKLINYNGDRIIYQIKNKQILRTTKSSLNTFDLTIINHNFSELNTREKTPYLKLIIDFNFLQDTIRTKYLKKSSLANQINKTYFNED